MLFLTFYVFEYCNKLENFISQVTVCCGEIVYAYVCVCKSQVHPVSNVLS